MLFIIIIATLLLLLLLLLFYAQVSNLVKRYNREEITVWATVNSSIMKKCRRTVNNHQRETESQFYTVSFL